MVAEKRKSSGYARYFIARGLEHSFVISVYRPELAAVIVAEAGLEHIMRGAVDSGAASETFLRL